MCGGGASAEKLKEDREDAEDDVVAMGRGGDLRRPRGLRLVMWLPVVYSNKIDLESALI